MKTSKILMKAAKLIDTPEKWCKGQGLGPNGARCAIAAISQVQGRKFDSAPYDQLVEVTEVWPAQFNDAPSTTHGDVMTAFALAIALAEDRGD